MENRQVFFRKIQGGKNRPLFSITARIPSKLEGNNIIHICFQKNTHFVLVFLLFYTYY